MPASGMSQDRLGEVPGECKGRRDARHRPAHRRSKDRTGQEGGNCAREDLDCEKELEGIAPKSCPAELTPPHFRGGSVTPRLLERSTDDPHPQSLLAHQLGRGCIFGDLASKRADAASPLENLPAPQHGLALREADPDAVGEALPARLVGIEKGAFELRPGAYGRASDRWRANETGARTPSGKETPDIVARHQHVAVGHDDPLVARGLPTLGRIVELGICAELVVSNEDARGYMRMSRDQAPHEGKHRVADMSGAEDDLIIWMVEMECRRERLLREIFHPADGPYDGHALRLLLLQRANVSVRLPISRNNDDAARKMENGGERAKTASQ